MTTLDLPGEIEVVFDHLAGYGLAAILQAAGAARPRVAWSDSLDSRLRLEDAVDWDEAGRVVHEHAVRAISDQSWIGGKQNVTGILSPRTMKENDPSGWYRARRRIVDGITGPDGLHRLDTDLIGALGEPAYWATRRDGKTPAPDNGASRWDMTTSNGMGANDFVRRGLRPVAAAVARRTPAQVTQGLCASSIRDEAGKNKPDSRTPTGLTAPRATDNARAWCALWGLSMMSVSHRVHPPNAVSSSAGHTGSPGAGAFALPVMTTPWPLSMLRSVIASRALRDVAEAEASDASSDAWAWLQEQGVAGVVVCPVHRSANKNAPERWAQRGALRLPVDR